MQMTWDFLFWDTGAVIMELDKSSTLRSWNCSSLLAVIEVALQYLTFAGQYVEQIALLQEEGLSHLFLAPPLLTQNSFVQDSEDTAVDSIPRS